MARDDPELSSIRLYMPNGGESGVIVATSNTGMRVEFRGSPYSLWSEQESSPMSRIHSAIVRANIANLHSGEVETITPWHSEWEVVRTLFIDAINSAIPGNSQRL